MVGIMSSELSCAKPFSSYTRTHKEFYLCRLRSELTRSYTPSCRVW